MSVEVRAMRRADIPGAIALQRACFPVPFPEELLWTADHLNRHLDLFPEGQFVAVSGELVVASASNTRISHAVFEKHGSWEETVGGPMLANFDAKGSVMYGLDISVHPEWRRQGIARALYQGRFLLVGRNGIELYATACRLPGFAAWGPVERLDEYLDLVQARDLIDTTLSPLLKMGLTLVTGLKNYMEDQESHDCAALLEWRR